MNTELTQSSMIVLTAGRSRGKITLVGQKTTAIKMGGGGISEWKDRSAEKSRETRGKFNVKLY